MPRVTEINDIHALQHYQMCWRSLYQQTREASFFQTFEWLQSYWRHYGDGQQMRVLVVSSGGMPIGIVPLTVRRERTRIGAVRVLTYPLHDWGSFYGPIGPNPTATLMAAMRHLNATPRAWDMLDFRWINRDVDHGRTALAMQLAGLPHREWTWKTTHLVSLAGTWDAYLSTRSSKFRRMLRGCETRADRAGDVAYHRYRPLSAAEGDGDPRWSLYEECVDLAERSWQGASEHGTTLSHKGVDCFFREVHAVAARQGAVDVNLLRFDGELAAFAYLYHVGGRLYGVRMGYDPGKANLSPGTLLLARMLEDSFQRGDTHVDLGSDPADYKQRWMTGTRVSCRCTFYAPRSPRSQLLRLKHRFSSSAAS
jgi:CelD/BcsL family acetyltransferase involved in cellulose biosynthesis